MSTAQQEQFTFQAEIKQLLHLLAHSLYQNKEIAVRELVSNASDALDKMRFVALTDSSQRDAGALEINVVRDEESQTLTISDNGVGMTHDELVTNLGTIAHSGSAEFLKTLSGDSKGDVLLIGQFGVGFYSAFMLADTVQVRTRSYREDKCWQWESQGAGSFTITPIEEQPRGTSIVLKLRDDTKDFVNEYRIKSVLTKYSTFVPHPIKLDGNLVNDVKPIWVEPKSQLTQEQYDGFYQHLSHRSDEKPLWHLHLSADSPIQFRAILYCPATNIERFGLGRAEHGLHLCAKRVLVQSDCRDLLPEYMRFVYGLVDSEDLPLNISRESLQDNTIFRKIRATLVKKVLDSLKSLADEDAEKFRTFYGQFATNLKEGVNSDWEHRERIAELLRFPSTHDESEDALTSLDEYCERAGADQKQIYFLGGPDLSSIRSNPNLELFRRRTLEVLLLPDPIDEFVATSLGRYKEKDFASIDSATLELPEEPKDESKQDEDSGGQPPSGFAQVLVLFKEALGDKVTDVRESHRLTESPCCLVTPEDGASVQMQKLLKMANENYELPKRIFEVNPKNALIQRLGSLSANAEHVAFIKSCGLQLFDNAQLLEGSMPDPRSMVERVQEMMRQAAESRSPIIH